jgi:ligand-binding sensor domain-containing protein/PAS domain-containing protein
MKKLIFCTIIVWHSVVGINAQNLVFDKIRVEDGLSQSDVSSIFKDKYGVMWFGTRDGLNMFDGYNIKIFRQDPDDSLSLDNSSVTYISSDFNGNLLVGTYLGLNQYNYETGKFKRFPHNDGTNGSMLNGRVEGIYAFPEDNVIFITLTNGISIYFPEKNEFKNVSNLVLSDGTKVDNEFYSVIKAKNGLYYLTNRDDFLLEYNFKSNQFTKIEYKTEPGTYGENYRKYIYEDTQGNFIIGAQEHGLAIFNINSKQSKQFTTRNSKIPLNNINGGIIFIKNDEWWLGTDGGGILKYNPVNETFQSIQHNPKDPATLSANGIYYMYRDNNGIIWLGVYGGGVNIWNKYKYKFQSYKYNPDDPNSLGSGMVQRVYQDSKNRIWIGNDGGGLHEFDINKGIFKHYYHIDGNNNSLTNNVVLSVCEADENHLYVGGYNTGFQILDTETGYVKHYFSDNSKNIPGQLSSNHVWEIFVDSRKRVWIGLLTNGLDLYNPIDGTFTNYGLNSNSPIKVASSNVMHICEDNQGFIWMGTEGMGVFILDADLTTIKNLTKIERDTNSLSNNDVKSILFRDNIVFIGTYGGGLDVYNRENKTFRHITSKQGLSSDAISGMLMDKNEYLWISTSKGLNKLDARKFLDSNKIDLHVYDKNDGLAGNEFRYNAQWALSDGRFIFGGYDGINVFNPDSISDNPVVPPIIFTDFKLFNHSQKIGVKDSPLKKSINETERIKLNYKQNVFSIEFAALNYTSTKRNQYRYKMDGFDKDWIEAGDQRIAMYTNLNAGKYIFRVQASNNDKVWNTVGRSIVFKITPPWWKSWWFLLMLGLFIAYIVYIVIHERTKMVKHDKAILESKINEAEKEIFEKVLELENQKKEIEEREVREKELNFMNKGIAHFSKLISENRDNIEILSRKILSELIGFVNANSGVLFLREVIDNQVKLIPKATYCYSIEESTSIIFEPGEGNVGVCFTTKKIIELNNLSEGYLKLQSGLGVSKMKHLVLFPILLEDEPFGVIELASIRPLEKVAIEFVNNLTNNLASVLAITDANNNSKLMLEENRAKTEEILAQEEELRQNLEEMKAIQDGMERQLQTNSQVAQNYSVMSNLSQLIFERSTENIYYKDEKGSIKYISQNMARIFGFNNTSEIIDKRNYIIKNKELEELLSTVEREVLKKRLGIERKLLLDQNSYILSISPIFNQNNEIQGTFGYLNKN